MGQVWEATDTQLNRQVALKILPDAFADDPDRLARFQREAQVLASLNHPNIAQIHGIEEAEGTRALVLELVEGPTLADRIAKAPIPVDEALPIAKQIAEALEAAHEAGVIHRDLKPANIKVRDDGTVKVLDFGLAKAFQPEASAASATLSPTISLTAAATQMGMVIGTAAYMAPEQASGKAVDKRADVWAFGVVLYEMLTARKPFPGHDVSEVLATVIKSEPEWDALPDDTPPRVRQVLRACLRKQRKQRVHDVADVRLAMAGTFDTPVTGRASGGPPPLKAWQRPLPLTSIGLFVAVVAAGAGWAFRAAPQPTQTLRFTITPPKPLGVRTSSQTVDVVISPDGSRVAYPVPDGDSNRPEVLVRELARLDPTPIRSDGNSRDPSFSQDGEWIAFHAFPENDLLKVRAIGGATVSLGGLGAQPRGFAWTEDGRILMGAMQQPLRQLPDDGGTWEPLTTLDDELGESSHVWPSVIPGANAAVFAIYGRQASSPTDAELAAVRLDTGEVTRLGIAGTGPRYVDTGHLLFAQSDGSLLAVPFDSTTLEATGSPVPVLEDVQVKRSGAANYDVSRNGTLVYINGTSTDGLRRSLVWVDRDGTEEPIDVPPRAYTYARLSPDGRRVALDSRDEENDIWIWDLERQTLQRLTRGPEMNRGPVWSPDGLRLAFTAVTDGVEGPHWQPADGSGRPERLVEGIGVPSGFTPDGTRLLYAPQLAGNGDIRMISLDGATPATSLLSESYGEINAQVSPDGSWLVYQSNESGQNEIYVRPFPDVDSALQPVSTDGGSRPRWSSDGTELFYFAEPDTIMAVPVETGETLTLGRPTVAVQGPYARPLNAGTHS